MILSPPLLIGTPFRPVAAGFDRRQTGGDGFRPVVAGQYLRTNPHVDRALFTFLTPTISSPAEYRLAVNLSPQLIWHAMQPPAERADVASKGVTATTDRLAKLCEVVLTLGSTMNSPSTRPAAMIPPSSPTYHQPVQRPTEAHPVLEPHSRAMTDRFTTLYEILQGWGARTDFPSARAPAMVPSTSPAYYQPRQRSSEVYGGVPTESPAMTDRFTKLCEIAHWVFASLPTSGRPSDAVVQQWMTFAPVSLRFQNSFSAASGVRKHDSGPVIGPAWQVPLRLTMEFNGPRDSERQDLRSPAQDSWHPGRPTSGYDPSESTSKAENHLPVSGLQAEARTLVPQKPGFGAIAAVGILRPAGLVPAVYRTRQLNDSQAPTTGADVGDVLGGVLASEEFALAVSSRHQRSEGASRHATASPVHLVVRTNGVSPAGTSRNDSSEQNAPTFESRPHIPQVMAGLPPDLMQKLTEQVMRSLDSRAIAASERAGRF